MNQAESDILANNAISKLQDNLLQIGLNYIAQLHKMETKIKPSSDLLLMTKLAGEEETCFKLRCLKNINFQLSDAVLTLRFDEQLLHL